MEAVKRGTTAVGVVGTDVLVLAVEKKATAKLQDARTVRKIVKIDEHVCLAFAGLLADARVLVDRARVEAQSYRLTFDDKISVEQVARHVSGIQQKYTQSGGVRPFGVSTLIMGFDDEGRPHLYQTDPAGTHSEWTASVIGKNSKAVREWLEKNCGETGGEATIELAVKALMETVEASSKTIEVAAIRKGEGMEILGEERIDAIIKKIEAEKEEEAAGTAGAMQTD